MTLCGTGNGALSSVSLKGNEPRNDYAQRFPAVAQLLLDHGAEITISAFVTVQYQGGVDLTQDLAAKVRQGILDTRRYLGDDGPLHQTILFQQPKSLVKGLLAHSIDLLQDMLKRLGEPASSSTAFVQRVHLSEKLTDRVRARSSRSEVSCSHRASAPPN
jgi:hypothetical protein